jgi:hypothetical protein
MERLLGVHSKEKQLSKVLGIDHCLIAELAIPPSYRKF